MRGGSGKDSGTRDGTVRTRDSERAAQDGSSTYWFFPDLLLAGPHPGALDEPEARRRLRRLMDLGIRHFVDLTEEGEFSSRGHLVLPYAGLLVEEARRARVEADYRRFGIQDLWVPTRDGMTEILDHLDVCAGRREPAYVHCLGGRGRTGTVVACWLLREATRNGGPLSGKEALRRLHRLRESQGIADAWDSPQTSVQFEFVRGWSGA